MYEIVECIDCGLLIGSEVGEDVLCSNCEELEQLRKMVKQKENIIRELEGALGWHIEANERYEKALKQIQNNYPVEDVDYIPITALFEIQLTVKNALD